jgi:type IV pilus assembly protein PilE
MKGFSLIELMITLAIVAMLASIVYPSYGFIVRKMHRTKAQHTLVSLSQALELYRVKNGSYENATLETLIPADFSDDYYQYAVENLTADDYLLKAIPIEPDAECGVLSLNTLLEKGSIGAECW